MDKVKQWDYIKKLGGAGILRRSDLEDLSNQRTRVLWLMLDGLPHTASEIIKVSGGREGLRRMRELREIPYVTIQRDRGVGRDFTYCLIYRPGIQRELF